MNPSPMPNAHPTRPRDGSFDSQDSNHEIRDRQELAQMALGLRRMKRKLFLMHVEENLKPADSLRDLILKATSRESNVNTHPQSPPGSPIRQYRSDCLSEPSSPASPYNKHE